MTSKSSNGFTPNSMVEYVLFKKDYHSDVYYKDIDTLDYKKDKLYKVLGVVGERLTAVYTESETNSCYVPNIHFYTPEETTNILRVAKIKRIQEKLSWKTSM